MWHSKREVCTVKCSDSSVSIRSIYARFVIPHKSVMHPTTKFVCLPFCQPRLNCYCHSLLFLFECHFRITMFLPPRFCYLMLLNIYIVSRSVMLFSSHFIRWYTASSLSQSRHYMTVVLFTYSSMFLNSRQVLNWSLYDMSWTEIKYNPATFQQVIALSWRALWHTKFPNWETY